jgi:hypothetical protein
VIRIQLLTLFLGLVGQTPASPGDAPDDPAARLEVMKRTMAAYNVRPSVEGRTSFRLNPDPILRFTNTVGETRDGAIFLWLGAGDRPEAAAQVFERRDGAWILELSSLSTGSLVATSTSGHEWSPAAAGVEFKALPDAPRPAATAEQRLRQMRDLTRDITAEDFFRNKTWQPLRMLPRPFARYGKEDSDVIDGALFAYVLTTDPEVYLMLEVHKGKDGPEWQYAFAPSSVYQVRGKVKGVEVWELPRRQTTGSRDANKPFHVHQFQPER